MEKKLDANDLEELAERDSNNTKVMKRYLLGSGSSALVGIVTTVAANYVGSDSSAYLPLMYGAIGGLTGTVLLGVGAVYHGANELQRMSIDFPLDEYGFRDMESHTRNGDYEHDFVTKNPMRYKRF